ncbi:MAG: flagellar export protein FliJ [Gammaproteobacteria bacterium]
MKRSERMQTVERVVCDAERKRAEALAARERHVKECESKLQELESYQKSYAEQFQTRAAAGIGAVGMRDFQAFMLRLGEAVKQQIQLVAKAKADRDTERTVWQHAAQRAEAVGGLVERWQKDEQRQQDRQDQRDSDERAQRVPRTSLHN